LPRDTTPRTLIAIPQFLFSVSRQNRHSERGVFHLPRLRHSLPGGPGPYSTRTGWPGSRQRTPSG
jgi:hypothetical protein